MPLMMHIFAPILLSDNEYPMQKQHCRLSRDTMKSLSSAEWTLKYLIRSSNRCSH